MRHHALLFEQLEIVETMKTFITHRMSGREELRAKLERVESDLAATQKTAADGAEALKLVDGEKETIRDESEWLRNEGKTVEAKCKGVEQENVQLKKEIEELRAKFAAQRKELEEEYQKQVDKMYFYDYRCCMKKNDITQDTLPFPSDDEGEVPNTSS